MLMARSSCVITGGRTVVGITKGDADGKQHANRGRAPDGAAVKAVPPGAQERLQALLGLPQQPPRKPGQPPQAPVESAERLELLDLPGDGRSQLQVPAQVAHDLPAAEAEAQLVGR